MLHVHQLDGCAPTPLAHYLKALGILRLVAEQKDAQVRGWWEDDHFRLATKLDQKDLEDFFLCDYQPTPIFNPWGARSGFYEGSSEKSARESLNQIKNSSSGRLEPFRKTVKMVQSVIDDATTGDKPSTEEEKNRLVLALRSNTRGVSSLWLDTVIALSGAGDDISLAQPPIFGTGGSEGSGGYPSAYMSAVVEAVLKQNWNHTLSSVIFGSSTVKCYWNQSMGQFSPGGTSTPWDMLFAFEGACVLRSSVGGRTSTNSQKWMCSPFYVAPRSSGYVSNSRLDEKYLDKGREYPGRGEQWFPMWEQPAQFHEVQQMFSQGRAATKKGRATDGWTMARAVTGFGTSRGIREFLRYGYQQRNNQATHFAISLGRFRTPDTKLATSAALPCLDDLDRWIRSLHQEAHPADDQSAKRVPARLAKTYGRLTSALFAVLDKQTTDLKYQDILLCLGDMEAVMRGGSGYAVQPIPRLRPEWVAAAYDGSAEFRLALTFALQAGGFRRGDGTPVDLIRRHWLPLDRKQPWRFATTGTGAAMRLDVKPDVVMHGRYGIDDAISLVERRLIEASQRGDRRLPLKAAPRASVSITDLAELLSGAVDLDRTLALARPLMALERKQWAEQYIPIESPRTSDWPNDVWLAIRLCMLPWPIETRSGSRFDIGVDPTIFRRLATGDATSAIELSLRRLHSKGVRPVVRAGTVPPYTARLWAAALGFPIAQRTATEFLYRLDPNTK